MTFVCVRQLVYSWSTTFEHLYRPCDTHTAPTFRTVCILQHHIYRSSTSTISVYHRTIALADVVHFRLLPCLPTLLSLKLHPLTEVVPPSYFCTMNYEHVLLSLVLPPKGSHRPESFTRACTTGSAQLRKEKKKHVSRHKSVLIR